MRHVFGPLDGMGIHGFGEQIAVSSDAAVIPNDHIALSAQEGMQSAHMANAVVIPSAIVVGGDRRTQTTESSRLVINDIEAFEAYVVWSSLRHADIAQSLDGDSGALERLQLSRIYNIKTREECQLYDIDRSLATYTESIKKDRLTGAYNRTAFWSDCGGALLPSNKGLIAVDVAGLKQANDLYSHDKGNAILRCAVEAVDCVFSHYEIPYKMYRFGGDEFVVVYEKTATCVDETMWNEVNVIHGLLSNADFSFLRAGHIEPSDFDRPVDALIGEADTVEKDIKNYIKVLEGMRFRTKRGHAKYRVPRFATRGEFEEWRADRKLHLRLGRMSMRAVVRHTFAGYSIDTHPVGRARLPRR